MYSFQNVSGIICRVVSIEKYEERRGLSKHEYVDYDDFCANIAESVNANNGTDEDVLFIAEDAFEKMS